MGVSLELQPEDERVECAVAYREAGGTGRIDVPAYSTPAEALASNTSAQCRYALGSDTACSGT